MRRTIPLIAIGIALCVSAALALTAMVAGPSMSPTVEMAEGKVQLTSAGAMTFGPPGILFVGDSIGASVVAIDTEDTKAPTSAVKISVEGIDAKVAAMVGVTPDQVVINDVKVNPVSKNVYVSASRGRGPDAAALLVRVDATGKISQINLDNAKHASVSFSDLPASNPSARQDPRTQTITDIAYV